MTEPMDREYAIKYIEMLKSDMAECEEFKAKLAKEIIELQNKFNLKGGEE